jgi:hypothetical protein
MRSRIPRCVKTGSEGSDIMGDGGGRDVDKGKKCIKGKGNREWCRSCNARKQVSGEKVRMVISERRVYLD